MKTKYEKLQEKADKLYMDFQTIYKIDPDIIDEYSQLIEEMTIIRQEEC